MKKALTGILAGVLAITCLVGCGPKDGTTSGEKVDLLIGLPGGDGVTDPRIVDNFIEARKDQYNVTTDEGAWGDFIKKVKLQLVSKNDITPVFFTDSEQATAFGAQGALEPLNTYVESLDESLYNSALRGITDKDGNLWGVPHALNSVAMIYNKDIFDERGVAYPTEDWTWEDMMKMAEELTFDRDGDGKTDVYGIYYTTNDTQGWRNFMYAYGTSPVKDDYRNSNLDSPEVLQALEAYQKPVLNGWVMDPGEVAAKGSAELAFCDGSIAMYLCQASGLRVINNNAPDLNYDAQIMPIGWNGERSCLYVPNVWVIAEHADKAVKDAAWDWISFFLSEESQMIAAENTLGGYPIMKKALDAVSANGVKPEGKDAFYRGIDQWGRTGEENPCSTNISVVGNALANKIRFKEDLKTNLEASHIQLQEELDFFYEQ